ncbi:MULTISPECIES: hypothetical protein [unclassified Anabaena]|uniref:hypothetical protein n=1 Tax=unclassified Anabaena TaxID=2619674 RepID=UPI002B2113AB|nr:hypothetical protein [Anabaena sp. UHCC 0399]MEA5565230.1 hypothetical protein [Anabaena sp. UHCC 0399]
MSLQQVNAFYEVLISETSVYEAYFNNCCNRGLLSSWHWDTTKIVNFAATLGYKFTEYELTHVWFEGEPSFSDDSLSLSKQSKLLELTKV